MISLRHRVLWASLMASAAFAASAQLAAPLSAPVPAQSAAVTSEAAPAKPAKPGHPRAEHKKHDSAERLARMQKHRAERQAKLKDTLKLSAAQEAAWTQYISATQPAAPEAGQPRAERVDIRTLTTPERLDHMQARQAAHQARFAQHAQATKQFYAQLTPEQQKSFDADSIKRPHRAKHRGHETHRGHEGGKPASATPAKS